MKAPVARPFSLAALAVGGLPGCLFISASENAGRMAWGDSDSSASGDADADADADSDGDSDSDADTDDYGAFGGIFSMNVQGAATPSDSCAGDATLQVTTGGVSGTFTCAFTGTARFYEDQYGRIEGDTAGGTLTFTSSFQTDVPWTGTWSSATSPASLDGFYSGSGIAYNLDQLAIAGYFNTTGPG